MGNVELTLNEIKLTVNHFYSLLYTTCTFMCILIYFYTEILHLITKPGFSDFFLLSPDKHL